MRCPHCDFSASRMSLHAHLVNEHGEEIRISVDQGLNRMVFELTCPICKDSVKQPLRKHPAVLEEYRREIQMVAFDLLLYHLAEKHAEDPPEEP